MNHRILRTTLTIMCGLSIVASSIANAAVPAGNFATEQVVNVAASPAGNFASETVASAPAEKVFRVSTPNLTFEIDGDASFARFIVNGKDASSSNITENQKASSSDNGEFWRLILDDGMKTEIPVLSNAQKGKVSRKGENWS